MYGLKGVLATFSQHVKSKKKELAFTKLLFLLFLF